MIGVPLQIVADVEVEVAVVVEVGPGRRRRPITVAPKPRLRRGVLEPAPALIAIQGVGPPSGDEEVGPAVQVLREGGVVIVFCDEGFGGVIRGPFFGRPPYPQGNLALATRLARKTGATICTAYNIRTEGFRFKAHVLPPITLPPETVPRERFVEDMLLLNSVVEPVVRAHLDQWYFLDSSL